MNPQEMKQIAFEQRMKRVFFTGEVKMIKSKFIQALPHHCMNSLNTSPETISEIIRKDSGFTYYELGIMLQSIIGCSFEKLQVTDNIEGFIRMFQDYQKSYNEFASKSDKEAESEVKTKLQIMRK